MAMTNVNPNNNQTLNDHTSNNNNNSQLTSHPQYTNVPTNLSPIYEGQIFPSPRLVKSPNPVSYNNNHVALSLFNPLNHNNTNSNNNNNNNLAPTALVNNDSTSPSGSISSSNTPTPTRHATNNTSNSLFSIPPTTAYDHPFKPCSSSSSSSTSSSPPCTDSLSPSLDTGVSPVSKMDIFNKDIKLFEDNMDINVDTNSSSISPTAIDSNNNNNNKLDNNSNTSCNSIKKTHKNKKIQTKTKNNNNDQYISSSDCSNNNTPNSNTSNNSNNNTIKNSANKSEYSSSSLDFPNVQLMNHINNQLNKPTPNLQKKKQIIQNADNKNKNKNKNKKKNKNGSLISNKHKQHRYHHHNHHHHHHHHHRRKRRKSRKSLEGSCSDSESELYTKKQKVKVKAKVNLLSIQVPDDPNRIYKHWRRTKLLLKKSPKNIDNYYYKKTKNKFDKYNNNYLNNSDDIEKENIYIYKNKKNKKKKKKNFNQKVVVDDSLFCYGNQTHDQTIYNTISPISPSSSVSNSLDLPKLKKANSDNGYLNDNNNIYINQLLSSKNVIIQTSGHGHKHNKDDINCHPQDVNIYGLNNYKHIKRSRNRNDNNNINKYNLYSHSKSAGYNDNHNNNDIIKTRIRTRINSFPPYNSVNGIIERSSHNHNHKQRRTLQIPTTQKSQSQSEKINHLLRNNIVIERIKPQNTANILGFNRYRRKNISDLSSKSDPISNTNCDMNNHEYVESSYSIPIVKWNTIPNDQPNAISILSTQSLSDPNPTDCVDNINDKNQNQTKNKPTPKGNLYDL